MGRLEGKVAFITGAARGQGRAHAVRLAREGADIIAMDACAPVDSVPYPLADKADLEETVRLVEDQDRRIVAVEGDVRDTEVVRSTVDGGVAELGRLDIVLANAGVASFSPAEEMSDATWDEMIGINLTGVFKAVRASIPHIKAGGRGGSIVLTSSTSGIKGLPNLAHYTAAKHGVVGLMKTLANELAPFDIRVNSLHPTAVNTGMIHNEATYRLFQPGVENPTREGTMEGLRALNALPYGSIDPEDVSNTIAFLVSDEARYITGVQLPIDAGQVNK